MKQRNINWGAAEDVCTPLVSTLDFTAQFAVVRYVRWYTV